MAKHHEALDILTKVRRRLLNRIADAVASNKSTLLRDRHGGDGDDPFAGVAHLSGLTDSLHQLNAAIDGLGGMTATGGPDSHSRHGLDGGAHARRIGMFDRFVDLVRRDQLREAAHELGRIFKMPLDRIITATEFFARAVRAHPQTAYDLPELCGKVGKSAPEQCVRLLVTTFGFQAVESMAAIRRLEEITCHAGSAPAHHPVSCRHDACSER